MIYHFNNVQYPRHGIGHAGFRAFKGLWLIKKVSAT